MWSIPTSRGPPQLMQAIHAIPLRGHSDPVSGCSGPIKLTRVFDGINKSAQIIGIIRVSGLRHIQVLPVLTVVPTMRHRLANRRSEEERYRLITSPLITASPIPPTDGTNLIPAIMHQLVMRRAQQHQIFETAALSPPNLYAMISWTDTGRVHNLATQT